MLGHFRLEEGAAMHLQVAQRAFLVLAHQPRVAGDIGRQDGCQLALHPFPAHWLTGPEREAAPQSRTERDLARGLVRATAFLERNKRRLPTLLSQSRRVLRTAGVGQLLPL